ncbi:hypothetical protein [Methanospirillum sp.]|uniref:hypothetical protein n=1 Tax=Methanospirillum sp. TaxID=45200 RepID=UPI002D7EF2A8|nr:hypothetical protein [Methanospirillum sp.]
MPGEECRFKKETWLICGSRALTRIEAGSKMGTFRVLEYFHQNGDKYDKKRPGNDDPVVINPVNSPGTNMVIPKAIETIQSII